MLGKKNPISHIEKLTQKLAKVGPPESDQPIRGPDTSHILRGGMYYFVLWIISKYR